MKKKTIPALVLISSFFLGACNGSAESSSLTSEESKSSSSSESSSSNEETLTIPSVMVGRWYIYSSSAGVLPLNGIFDINENNTLSIGERTLTLSGHYAGYEETYKFVYGTITFIVSYDEEKDGIDWGYTNASTSDFGFATRTYIDNFYAYEGNKFPMEQIKKYLGTTLDIPVYENDSYKLKFFTSYFTNDKCASIELADTTADKTLAYINLLKENGYTFYADVEKITSQKAYVSYDSTKTYTIRIIHFADDSETDIFVHPYCESLKS